MRALKWDDLNRFGKNRMLQSSYIWLLVVPMAAKALSAVDDPLVLTGISEGLRIHLTLPFSWQLFYVSAVVVSVAGVVYGLLCPDLIKKFNTFEEFRAEGRGFEYLLMYADRRGKQARSEEDAFNAAALVDEVKELSRSANLRMNDPDRGLSDLFWRMHSSENSKSPIWRTVCFTLYCVGLLLITIVLVQNFVFVVRATWLPAI